MIEGADHRDSARTRTDDAKIEIDLGAARDLVLRD